MDADPVGARPAHVGRFAPSPTGPLHFGSLVAALGSFLEARSRGGRWLLRIDDLDPPREVPGAADDFLRELERLGLCWDGEVVHQSTRADAYAGALAQLRSAGLVFGCACSRREVGPGVYPGTCRNGTPSGRRTRSIRMRVNGHVITLEDRIQGTFEQVLARDVGDFVLLRADGVFAYHLAVAVDDAEAAVTDVVRGGDLLDSTPRQILLQRALGLPTPRYAHLPVAIDARGGKLSKQTHARPTRDVAPATLLGAALAFLGHAPPARMHDASAGELLAWAVAAWRIGRVPRVPARAPQMPLA